MSRGRLRGPIVRWVTYTIFGAALIGFPLAAQMQNQAVGIGFTNPILAPALPSAAPGSVMTLFTPVLDVPDAVAAQMPLPRSLSGVVVLARVVGAVDSTGYPQSLPILRVQRMRRIDFIGVGGTLCAVKDDITCSHTEITVQIPTEHVCEQPEAEFRGCADPSQFGGYPPLLILNVQANGVTGPDLPVRVGLAAVHLLRACDSIFGVKPIPHSCAPLVTHADGTLIDEAHPASTGEVITLYAVGLGSNVPTGEAATAPTPPVGLTGRVVTFSSRVVIRDSTSGAVATPLADTVVLAEYVGHVVGTVGLFQINVQVPPPLIGFSGAKLYACAGFEGSGTNTDVSLSVPGIESLRICVRE
jgi:uncharacterized protein (TIGR03437 family)